MHVNADVNSSNMNNKHSYNFTNRTSTKESLSTNNSKEKRYIPMYWFEVIRMCKGDG